MRSIIFNPPFSLLLATAGAAIAASNLRACPLLGQQYPPPVQISSDPGFQAATKQVEAALKSSFSASILSETSFSIGMFSTSEPGILWEYHSADALLSNSSAGTRKLNADSIYRIGSISKLLTVYMFLLAADGDRHFNDPIAEHIPALVPRGSAWNPVTPEWNDITIGDLAGQMAGLARDYSLADLAPPQGLIGDFPAYVKNALPKLPNDEVPKCGYLTPSGNLPACSVDNYVAGVASESPIFATAYTPVYSNEAFALVGLALENIVHQPLESIFNNNIVKPLGLTGTYYTVPNITPNTAVIPGTPLEAGWSVNLGIFGLAGGYFSSTNDMATIGKAILSSQQLPVAQTRRWLKPSSFVESFEQGVGRPWEIYRTKVRGQSIDIYSKDGDWGVYSTAFILVPQYDFGFTLLTANDPGSEANGVIRDAFPNNIANIILPVLDDIARKQAIASFAGHYFDTKSNSSLTITTNPQGSGLIVSQWTNNGVNLINIFNLLVPDLVWRLQPNQISYGKNKVGFTSYYASAEPPANNSVIFFKCSGWVDVDELNYGNIPLGQIVFNLNAEGSAASVELRALRTTLRRM